MDFDYRFKIRFVTFWIDSNPQNVLTKNFWVFHFQRKPLSPKNDSAIRFSISIFSFWIALWNILNRRWPKTSSNKHFRLRHLFTILAKNHNLSFWNFSRLKSKTFFQNICDFLLELFWTINKVVVWKMCKKDNLLRFCTKLNLPVPATGDSADPISALWTSKN